MTVVVLVCHYESAKIEGRKKYARLITCGCCDLCQSLHQERHQIPIIPVLLPLSTSSNALRALTPFMFTMKRLWARDFELPWCPILSSRITRGLQKLTATIFRKSLPFPPLSSLHLHLSQTACWCCVYTKLRPLYCTGLVRNYFMSVELGLGLTHVSHAHRSLYEDMRECGSWRGQSKGTKTQSAEHRVCLPSQTLMDRGAADILLIQSSISVRPCEICQLRPGNGEQDGLGSHDRRYSWHADLLRKKRRRAAQLASEAECFVCSATG